MTGKSAKDLAFDRERLKYMKQIKELSALLKQKDTEISEAKAHAIEAESKCIELQDWVNRLLEYMDLPEDEMRRVFQRQKETSEFVNLLGGLFGLPQRFF